MAGRIVLAGVCRTAVGSMGGALNTVPAQELGAIVIKEALNRTNIGPEQVGFVYMGCMLQVGLGQNAARQLSTQAGIPVETPAVTISVACGSGLNCVNLTTQMARSGDADIVIAGDMENMSVTPYLLKDTGYGHYMNNGTMMDSMVHDALWDAFSGYRMGITTENIAERWGLTRQELDEFAAASQQKAYAAAESGRFKDETVPAGVKEKKKTVQLDINEDPRPKTTAEGIAKLRPAFKKDGVATATNASSINDGTTAVMMMSDEKTEELGVKPMAYWRAEALAGVAPEIMGIGPVAATKKVLARTGVRMEDLDLIETNEAFAAQSLAASGELSSVIPKVNVDGGAIALGHPVGTSGCRILVALLHEMGKRDAKKDLATLCIGSGVGYAAIIEWE